MKTNTITLRPTIGIVAIAKNEERDLPGFLECLLSWVDEIVIVDDESTDLTRVILKNAGSKVKTIVHGMDATKGFSGQRNIGIDAATTDWLLHMDIDERITPQFADEVLSVIRNPNYVAYRYRRRNYFLQRQMQGGGWQTWNQPQLAKRNFHRFKRPLHEECVIDGKSNEIGQLGNVMWHLTDECYLERMQKSFSYCQGIAQELIERNRIVRWYDFLLGPLFVFMKEFFFRHGFKDGVLGLMFSVHSACSQFRSYALAWDEQNKVSRDEIEKYLIDQWDVYKSSDTLRN